MESGTPGPSDDVIIQDGHVVTLNGGTYTHTGNITIHETGELIAKTGNSSKGFVFDGNEFHVFGTFTVPSPSKDLEVTGNSLFWGHPTAVISISDDWFVSDNSEVILEGICVDVFDDFYIENTSATVCGAGGISIGNNPFNNTFQLLNGATTAQICTNTNIFRGVGDNCETLVAKGIGNQEPTAIDDQIETDINISIAIDVLDMGTPDSDLDLGQTLKIISLGNDPLSSDNLSSEGGNLTINDNGTPNDSTDDFVDYQPPSGYIGTDFFTYVITDQNGAYSYAEVTIKINNPLPVNLFNFFSQESACKIELKWATASERNNDFFEIEKSTDGIRFQLIGKIDGAGSSTSFHAYNFIDDKPTEQNYYRLKQTDFDGNFTYSNIIFIASNCDKKENVGIVTLFPNPVIGRDVQLQFNARQVENSRIVISNLSGLILTDQTIPIEIGENLIAFDVSPLSSGTYFMHFGNKTMKFVKQN